MRIVIKTVKGREYLQLIHGKYVYHIGSATNFDSWVVAFMAWEKNLRAAYLYEREQMLKTVQKNVTDRILVSDSELQVFRRIKSRDEYDFKSPQRSTRIPRVSVYGSYVEKDYPWNNYSDDPFEVWCLNERGITLRKRITEIRFKERRIKKKQIK